MLDHDSQGGGAQHPNRGDSGLGEGSHHDLVAEALGELSESSVDSKVATGHGTLGRGGGRYDLRTDPGAHRPRLLPELPLPPKESSHSDMRVLPTPSRHGDSHHL